MKTYLKTGHLTDLVEIDIYKLSVVLVLKSIMFFTRNHYYIILSSLIYFSICLYTKNLKFIFSTDFKKEIFRKLNIILHKINMIERRMEVHEEQCHLIHDRREEDINIIDTEEMGLPLCDTFALDTLEEKLKDKEFFESMVCYFLT